MGWGSRVRGLFADTKGPWGSTGKDEGDEPSHADSGGDDGSNKGFDGQETFNYKARIVSGGTIAPNTTRPW